MVAAMVAAVTCGVTMRSFTYWVILALLALAPFGCSPQERGGDAGVAPRPDSWSSGVPDQGAEAPAQSDDSQVVQAYGQGLSDVQVRGSATVSRILPDDTEGSQHQRFILKLSSGKTLLIAHNIDLAPRIPGLREGDVVEFYGEYVWNELGGVVHWTHHDPGGRHVGGWLRHQGRTYQ